MEKRTTDRWLFIAMAVLMLVIVGVGYGPRVFLAGLYQPVMHSVIVRLHLVFVSLWLCAFAAQTLFAMLGKIGWHRRFGLWAFRIGAVWVVTALLALAALLHEDETAGVSGLVLLTRIGIFAVFLWMAYRTRNHPAAHKRWLLLGMSQAVIGGIRALPIAVVHDTPGAAASIALLFPLAMVFYDAWKLKRIEWATLWGGTAVICVHLIRIPLSQTRVWLEIAHWVGTWGL